MMMFILLRPVNIDSIQGKASCAQVIADKEQMKALQPKWKIEKEDSSEFDFAFLGGYY